MEDEGFARREGRDVDDICTTLFEAYLRNSRSEKLKNDPCGNKKPRPSSQTERLYIPIGWS